MNVTRQVRLFSIVGLTLAGVSCGSGRDSLSSPSRQARGPAAQASTTSSAADDGIVSSKAVAPSLGIADSYAVLAGSAVTNTLVTMVTGDLGVSPGAAISGFPPGVITGVNPNALGAQGGVTAAFNNLQGQACNVVLTGTDLGGLTLTPGTYCFASSAQLTGTLTLDALGNPGAVWVFQIGSTLTTASGSRVVIINGGQACGLFWQIGSSATLGTTTAFQGNILALASITLNTGASNLGGLFARTAAVTLQGNNVTRVGSCGSLIQPPAPTPLPLPTPAVPVPAMTTIAQVGLLIAFVALGLSFPLRS